METFFTLLMQSHTLAFLVPFMVFVVTVFLVVRRLIGFLITIAFLGFAVVVGVAIANYDVVKHYLPDDNKAQVTQVEKMLKEFRADIERAFSDLHEDFRDQRQSLRRLANSTRDMLDEVDEHTNSFRHFVQDTVVPAMEMASHKSDEAVNIPEALPEGLMPFDPPSAHLTRE